MEKQEIFKIQVPLHSSEENPPLLVYNRNRSVFFQMDMTPTLKSLIAGRYKVYVLGYIDENQIFQVVHEAKSQNW